MLFIVHISKYHLTDEEQENGVGYEEGTTTVLVGEVGEAPDVADADREADAGEDELPLGDAQGKQAEVEEQQQGQRQHVAGLELKKLVSVRVRERQAALRIMLRESRVHHRRKTLSDIFTRLISSLN